MKIFLGLEKEEIGSLSSQLNKALLDCQKGLGVAITPSGDLRGDFLVSGKGRKRWLLREDKQKENYGMFFSGLDPCPPSENKASKNSHSRPGLSIASLKMILGSGFSVLPINSRVKKLSLGTEKEKS